MFYNEVSFKLLLKHFRFWTIYTEENVKEDEVWQLNSLDC